ncbi:50S ribosomal protein L10 [Candidatus Falkowbacteria bacterium]|nr:50S ribosomal protein L10 [Candidatus Falkowbacteria bacterium]
MPSWRKLADDFLALAGFYEIVAAGAVFFMLTRKQKEETVSELSERLDKMKALVLIDYSGMKVGKMAELRRELKKVGAELKVFKRRLVDLAMKKSGLSFDIAQIKGQLALIFGYGDEVGAAKTTHKLSEGNKIFKIIAGIVGGNSLDAASVSALAKLPTREELLAKFVGTVSAPMSGMVNVLQGNTRGLVRVLSAYAEKRN